MTNMIDPDVQYLRDLARGYAQVHIGEVKMIDEYRRLQAIADRLESFIQAEAAKKAAGWQPARDAA